jgi:hypothetical protein
MTAEQLAALREELRTQDNACTAHPLYCVYDRMRIYGLDSSHAESWVWVDDEYAEADADTLNTITYGAMEYDDAITIAGTTWRRIGVRDERRFITCCLTRAAAIDYVNANSHRFRKPEVYVESLTGNEEMIALRNHLMGVNP